MRFQGSSNLGTDRTYTAWSAVFSTLRPISDDDFATHRTLLKLSTYFSVSADEATAAHARMLDDFRLARQALDLMACDAPNQDMVPGPMVSDGLTPVMLSALRCYGRDAQAFYLSALTLALSICPSGLSKQLSASWQEVREFAQGQRDILAADTRMLILDGLIGALEEKFVTVKASQPRPHLAPTPELSMPV